MVADGFVVEVVESGEEVVLLAVPAEVYWAERRSCMGHSRHRLHPQGLSFYELEQVQGESVAVLVVHR